KVLATRYGRREFLVAINMAAGAVDAEAAFARLARVAERFLRVRVEYQGYVPYEDRKSTRLNSSHRTISYAVFCLKKKKSTMPSVLAKGSSSRSRVEISSFSTVFTASRLAVSPPA